VLVLIVHMIPNNTLPFSIKLHPGVPVYEQLVMAVKRAVCIGQLKKGDLFPSVRELARKLSINPNTVQKAVGELVHEGLLEVRPGVGTFVARERVSTSQAQRQAFLEQRLANFVIEAKYLGITRAEVLLAMRKFWRGGVKR